jgi:hypothetical protein
MGERALAFLQGSLETSKGSNNAATRILMARMTNPQFNQPREFQEEDRGTLVAAGRYVAGVKDYSFSVEGAANYEQLGWFLETGLKGSVSATTVGTTGKRYTFTPNTTSAGDDLQAASFEFGDDTQGFLTKFCEATSWSLGFDTITPGQAAPLNMTFNYLTNALASNTKTANLVPPTVTSILATGATFAIGTTTTGFGSLSTVAGSLRSFTLNVDNRLGRKVFVGDGLTYSNIGRGRRVTTFDAVFEGDANGVTRFVDWDVPTERNVRITFSGPTIAGSSPATAYQLWIDAQVVFTAFDPTGAEDTNTVFRMSGRMLESSLLPVNKSDISLTLTNAEASYT